MKKFLIALALVFGLAVPSFAASADAPKSSVSFGGDGLIIAESGVKGIPQNGLAAGISFGLPENAGTLDLEGTRGGLTRLYNVDISPNLGKYVFVPFGVSYLDIAGQGEYGINAGIGLRMFPDQHLGLKFSIKDHYLRNELFGHTNYADARAMVVLSF